MPTPKAALAAVLSGSLVFSSAGPAAAQALRGPAPAPAPAPAAALPWAPLASPAALPAALPALDALPGLSAPSGAAPAGLPAARTPALRGPAPRALRRAEPKALRALPRGVLLPARARVRSTLRRAVEARGSDGAAAEAERSFLELLGAGAAPVRGAVEAARGPSLPALHAGRDGPGPVSAQPLAPQRPPLKAARLGLGVGLAAAAALLAPHAATGAHAAITAGGLVASVLLHELGHLWALRRLGDDTALKHGRFSMNPLRRVDPLGTLALPFLTLALSTSLFGVPLLLGWARPVPVDFNRISRGRTALAALAGPGANLAVAGLAGLAALAAPAGLFQAAAVTLAGMNLMLAAFNLLPLPNLDGGKVFAALLPAKAYARWTRSPRIRDEAYQGTFRRLYEGPANLLSRLHFHDQARGNLAARLATVALLGTLYALFWNAVGPAPLLFLMLPCAYDYYCIREKIQNEDAVNELIGIIEGFAGELAELADADDSVLSEVNPEEVHHVLKNAWEDVLDKVVDSEGFDALDADARWERLREAYLDDAVEALRRKGMSADEPAVIRGLLTSEKGEAYLARLRRWVEERGVFERWKSPGRKGRGRLDSRDAGGKARRAGTLGLLLPLAYAGLELLRGAGVPGLHADPDWLMGQGRDRREQRVRFEGDAAKPLVLEVRFSGREGMPAYGVMERLAALLGEPDQGDMQAPPTRAHRVLSYTGGASAMALLQARDAAEARRLAERLADADEVLWVSLSRSLAPAPALSADDVAALRSLDSEGRLSRDETVLPERVVVHVDDDPAEALELLDAGGRVRRDVFVEPSDLARGWSKVEARFDTVQELLAALPGLARLAGVRRLALHPTVLPPAEAPVLPALEGDPRLAPAGASDYPIELASRTEPEELLRLLPARARLEDSGMPLPRKFQATFRVAGEESAAAAARTLANHPGTIFVKAAPRVAERARRESLRAQGVETRRIVPVERAEPPQRSPDPYERPRDETGRAPDGPGDPGSWRPEPRDSGSAAPGAASSVSGRRAIPPPPRAERIVPAVSVRRPLTALPDASGRAPRAKPPTFEQLLDRPQFSLGDKEKRFLKDLLKEMKLESKPPITGRTEELKSVVRRVSSPRGVINSVVLVGEAGVGKTAIPEKLAQALRLAEERPEGAPMELRSLLGRHLLELDLNKLLILEDPVAALDGLLRLLAKLDDPDPRKGTRVILFVDEVHQLFQHRDGDRLANLLKKPLREGALTLIAATTRKEYKAHLEKDDAFRRRLIRIDVAEATPAETARMLAGARRHYEDLLGVSIRDEALAAAAEYSRFDQEGHLPGKAFDFVIAGARSAHPDVRFDLLGIELENALAELAETAALAAERTRAAQEDGDAKLVEATPVELYNRLIALSARAVDAAGALRSPAPGAPGVLDAEGVKAEIARHTGIASGQLTLGRDDARKYLGMEEALGRRVLGQEEAVRGIADAMRRNKAGLADPERPLGVFYLTGPTGVGKTHLAKELARFLFDDPGAVIRLDMSEYMEPHSVARMIGSPPGYVGFDDGGQLTEAVRRKPYSVILLDELEKAHSDVFQLLLQVLGEGRLTDGQGRTVDFKNAVILMTSNLGMHALDLSRYETEWDELRRAERELRARGASAEDARAELEPRRRALAESMRREVRSAAVSITEEAMRVRYPPEFQGRLDEVLVFQHLSPEVARGIVRLNLDDLARTLAKAGHRLEYDDGAVEVLFDRGFSVSLGARPLAGALRREVTSRLAKELLAASGGKGGKMRIRLSGGEEGMRFAVEPLPEEPPARGAPAQGAGERVFSEVLKRVLDAAAYGTPADVSVPWLDGLLSEALSSSAAAPEDEADAEEAAPDTEPAGRAAPAPAEPAPEAAAGAAPRAPQVPRPQAAAGPGVLERGEPPAALGTPVRAAHGEPERKDPAVRAARASIESSLRAAGRAEDEVQAVVRWLPGEEGWVGFLKLFVEHAKAFTPAELAGELVELAWSAGPAGTVVSVSRAGEVSELEREKLEFHFAGRAPSSRRESFDRAEARNVSRQQAGRPEDGRQLWLELHRVLAALPGARLGVGTRGGRTRYWLSLPPRSGPAAAPAPASGDAEAPPSQASPGTGAAPITREPYPELRGGPDQFTVDFGASPIEQVSAALGRLGLQFRSGVAEPGRERVTVTGGSLEASLAGIAALARAPGVRGIQVSPELAERLGGFGAEPPRLPAKLRVHPNRRTGLLHLRLRRDLSDEAARVLLEGARVSQLLDYEDHRLAVLDLGEEPEPAAGLVASLLPRAELLDASVSLELAGRFLEPAQPPAAPLALDAKLRTAPHHRFEEALLMVPLRTGHPALRGMLEETGARMESWYLNANLLGPYGDYVKAEWRDPAAAVAGLTRLLAREDVLLAQVHPDLRAALLGAAAPQERASGIDWPNDSRTPLDGARGGVADESLRRAVSALVHGMRERGFPRGARIAGGLFVKSVSDLFKTLSPEGLPARVIVNHLVREDAAYALVTLFPDGELDAGAFQDRLIDAYMTLGPLHERIQAAEGRVRIDSAADAYLGRGVSLWLKLPRGAEGESPRDAPAASASAAPASPAPGGETGAAEEALLSPRAAAKLKLYLVAQLRQGSRRGPTLQIQAAMALAELAGAGDLELARDWVQLENLGEGAPRVAAAALILARHGSGTEDLERIQRAALRLSHKSGHEYVPAQRLLVEALAMMLVAGAAADPETLGRIRADLDRGDALLKDARFLALARAGEAQDDRRLKPLLNHARLEEYHAFLRRTEPSKLGAHLDAWRAGLLGELEPKLLAALTAAEVGDARDLERLEDILFGRGRSSLDLRTAEPAARAYGLLAARLGAWERIAERTRVALASDLTDDDTYKPLLAALHAAAAAGTEAELPLIERVLRADPGRVDYRHEITQHEAAEAWARLARRTGAWRAVVRQTRGRDGRPLASQLERMLSDRNAVVNLAAVALIRLLAEGGRGAPGPEPERGPARAPVPRGAARVERGRVPPTWGLAPLVGPAEAGAPASPTGAFARLGPAHAQDLEDATLALLQVLERRLGVEGGWQARSESAESQGRDVVSRSVFFPEARLHPDAEQELASAAEAALRLEGAPDDPLAQALTKLARPDVSLGWAEGAPDPAGTGRRGLVVWVAQSLPARAPDPDDDDPF